MLHDPLLGVCALLPLAKVARSGILCDKAGVVGAGDADPRGYLALNSSKLSSSTSTLTRMGAPLCPVPPRSLTAS
jgi:hypothetical protein